MMRGNPALITEEAVIDSVIDKLLELIVESGKPEDIRLGLINMFIVGRTFPLDIDKTVRDEDRRENIEDCTHPDHMMSKSGGIESCARCGKTWG